MLRYLHVTAILPDELAGQDALVSPSCWSGQPLAAGPGQVISCQALVCMYQGLSALVEVQITWPALGWLKSEEHRKP